MAGNSQTLTKKELKTLLATAKPSADQHACRVLSRQGPSTDGEGAAYAEHADFLATQPGTIESKRGIGFQCTSHYRYFSKIYAQEATEAEAQAVQHDRLAKQLEARGEQK